MIFTTKPRHSSLVMLGVIAVLISIAACGNTPTDNVPSLKDAYEDAFMIGTALNHAQIFGHDHRGLDLIKKHFNSATPENVTKWALIHPRPGEYDFEAADRFVEFGEKNGMFMVGHTLVWHSQTPRWVFEKEDGTPATREMLLERLRDHIHTVVGRYKGRIQAWDVVNEALEEDGSLRESPWYRIIGEDYLVKAFEYAREADPDAELYYNDYSLENQPKRDGAVRLIRQLREQDVPVTGIGTQGHFMMDWPSIDDIDKTIAAFAELGVDVMITEMDIDVLPAAFDYQGADISVRAELQEHLNPYPDGLPDEVQQELTRWYREIFEVFLKHRDAISRVTLWGVTDADSWKNDWPVRGRTNYPLLFDREGKPKPAFFEVIALAREMNEMRQ
jgi:endo-1,4-beta-xylanase